MLMNDAFGLGVIIICLGLFFWFIVQLFLHSNLKFQTSESKIQRFSLRDDFAENPDAAILVSHGGTILSINDAARAAFNLSPSQKVDLEIFSRYLRPSESFLALCAVEGCAQLLFGEQSFEARSYCVGLDPVSMLVTLQLLPQPELEQLEKLPEIKNIQVLQDFKNQLMGEIGLERNLSLINTYLGQLISSDILEIAIWDDTEGYLSAYSFARNLPEFSGESKPVTIYYPGEGIAGKIAVDQKSFIIFRAESGPTSLILSLIHI
jgi:hypothetical protein